MPTIANQTRRFDSAHRLRPSEIALLETMEVCAQVAEAASALGISAKSARTRMGAIREKMGVETTAEAMRVWRARTNLLRHQIASPIL
jgi:DNA-binding CsgD family transcriptional regulator